MSDTDGRRDGDPPDVVMTDTARSKCYRMLSQFQLHRTVLEGLDGDARVYRRLHTAEPEATDAPEPPDDDELEYHVRTGRYSVVVKPELNYEGDPVLVVVTQMHAHAKYSNDRYYKKVDRIEVPL